jgi:hypothetical protein
VLFRHTSSQGAHIFRYPISPWTVFAQFCRHLQCHGPISNCDLSVFQNQFLHSCCVNTRPWCAGLSGCPFDHFRTLCNTFQYTAFSLCHHCTPPSGKNMFRPQNPTCTTNFFAGPSFQCCCHCTSTYRMNRIWLLRHLLHVTPTTSATSYQTWSYKF